ncbi:retrovirus-related Pol polyprotein from transposon gypsy [Trichonephila clavipes]|nr:retrovirus-related Pol polyprotein from transposon gypsy [Trichonephila clavipes]
MRGSRNSDNVERRGWNECRMSTADDSRKNWRNSEVLRRPSSGRNDYRGNGRQGNQWFDSRNRFQRDDRRFNDRGYQFRNGGQNDDFSRGDHRNRGFSENFSRGDRRQRSRLNALKPPVVSRPYRYDRVKQAILDYHVEKKLKEGTIITIQSPYASPVVLCRKNNGLPPDNPEVYRFAVDYRKLNSITKYPRYPLSLIDDLITNIPHMMIMSALDIKSGYFQLAVNPSDIIKSLIINKEGIKTDETKVRAIDEMKPPSNSKEVNRGEEGIRRGQGRDNESASFKIPDFKKPFVLFTDASSRGVGAVLNQALRPVVFASRTLSSAERNYTVTEKEFLVVVCVLNKFRTYLGSLPVKVITDHAALTRLTHASTGLPERGEGQRTFSIHIGQFLSGLNSIFTFSVVKHDCTDGGPPFHKDYNSNLYIGPVVVLQAEEFLGVPLTPPKRVTHFHAWKKAMYP